MMVSSDSPTIAKIKQSVSLSEARALLYIAICEVCDFFNVGKNMNDVQVAMTVDLILESCCHLKFEEIKYCFRRAMRQEKLYDRLDGNIIMGWLNEYEAERTEAAMQCSEAADRKCKDEEASQGGITFEQFIDGLRQRADRGDMTAMEHLKQIEGIADIGIHCVSREQRQQKDDEFKLFYSKYIIDKNKQKCQDEKKL